LSTTTPYLPARATTSAIPQRTDGTCPLPHRDDAPPQLDHDQYVCRACTGRLRGLLTDLPGLMADLDIALTQQARFSARVGSRATEARLPIGLPASDAAFVARTTILANVEWITAVRGHGIPQTWAMIATYLVEATPWLSRHPDGPQVVDELTAAVVNARRVIDRPADRTYLGRCGALVEIDITAYADPAPVAVAVDCPHELYAPVDRPDIDCPRCGTAWNVRARQDTLLAQLREHVLPAVDVARAVDGLGTPITPEVIRQWKRRGVLTPAADEQGRPRADERGRPLYRVGDVLDVVAGRVGGSSS
jgi:hypothetical protein